MAYTMETMWFVFVRHIVSLLAFVHTTLHHVTLIVTQFWMLRDCSLVYDMDCRPFIFTRLVPVYICLGSNWNKFLQVFVAKMGASTK